MNYEGMVGSQLFRLMDECPTVEEQDELLKEWFEQNKNKGDDDEEIK